MDTLNNIQQRWLNENIKKRQLWPLVLGAYTSLFLHIFFLIIFFVNSVTPMVILNVFSIAIFAIAIYILLKKQSFKLVMIFAAIEIYLHQLFAVYYVGWDANFQLYMLAIPIFLMLGEFRRIIVPLIASVTIMITLFLLYFYSIENSPKYPLETFQTYLSIINLLALVFGLSFYTGIFSVSSKMISESLSQSKKDIAQLYEAATVDNLTQLHNRMHASSFVEHLIRQAYNEQKPLTIAILDLDDFKQVNDQFGHHVGDLVLKHIANILANQVEDLGLTSRWGGEEFLIALSNCSKEGAQPILEDIRLSIANSPFESEQICIPLTSTIGATSLNDFNNHKNLSTLLKDADIALYQGKSDTKNQVVFFKS